MQLLSDRRLARRAAQGSRRAFEEIYRRYHQDLYRFCLAMLGNPQDAQDSLQNTMVKVLRALPGERRQIELRPWLYRIARNETIDTLRRRREGVELEPERLAGAPELAETAERRERLRGLIADLEELPERQRAALLMREIAGLDFAQIGGSLESSAAAARQTVYEARLSLRAMEAGREMSCEKVMRALSDADGRITRGREIRAHLRACASCRAFGEEIAERRSELAAIAPLPLAASGGLLHGLLGAGSTGGAATAGVGAASGAAGAGAGAAASAAIVKSLATVAVVAAVGVTAADRGGLIDTPLPGGGKSGTTAGRALPPGSRFQQAERDAASAAMEPAQRQRRGTGEGHKARSPQADGKADRFSRAVSEKAPSPEKARGGGRGHGARRGKPEGLPAAFEHGQQTAAAHRAPQANHAPGPPASVGRGSGKGTAKPSPPASEPQGKGRGKGRSEAPPGSSPAEPPVLGKSDSDAHGQGKGPPEH